METREKRLAKLVEIEEAIPELEAGNVYVGVPGDDGGEHRRYLARLREQSGELRRSLARD